MLFDMKSQGRHGAADRADRRRHEVNEVFFDDVEVPVENLIGEENQGWTIAKFLLGNERTGIARVGDPQARAGAAHEANWPPGSSRRQAA